MPRFPRRLAPRDRLPDARNAWSSVIACGPASARPSELACLRRPRWTRRYGAGRECGPPVSPDLTGFGHIAQFLGQVQQAGFVFDDLVGSIKHRGFCVLWLVRTTIKTGNHHLKQEMCRPHSRLLGRGRRQITLKLIHFTQFVVLRLPPSRE